MRRRYLRRTSIEKKSGGEKLTKNNQPTGFDLLSFWQWSYSNLVNQVNRDRFFEYIVACDLGRAKSLRNERSSYNLLTLSNIEVLIRSASPVQSWGQHAYTRIIFNLSPKNLRDKDRNHLDDVRTRRRAWVFGVFDPRLFDCVNPLETDQWSYYLITDDLMTQHFAGCKKVSLAKLEKVGVKKVRFGKIGTSIDELFCPNIPANAPRACFQLEVS